jgi:hypothetical protein
MKTRLVSFILSVLFGLLFFGLVFYTWKEYDDARVVVEWSTASEFDTVGFNIYRSDTPTDPGILVNAVLIPASEDAQTGGDYSYTDKDIVPGQVYYYYLEDVNANGMTNRHGPVEVKAQANGKIVWMLIIAMALVVLLGIVIINWPRRKTG